MPFVYVLRCCDGTFYVGHTLDLQSREQAHNDGYGSAYTAARRPVQMIYAEEHATISRAVTRERQLKRWTHQKKAALTATNAVALKRSSQRISKDRLAQTRTWRDLLKRLP